jgi:hypothetical protein
MLCTAESTRDVVGCAGRPRDPRRRRKKKKTKNDQGKIISWGDESLKLQCIQPEIIGHIAWGYRGETLKI